MRLQISVVLNLCVLKVQRVMTEEVTSTADKISFLFHHFNWNEVSPSLIKNHLRRRRVSIILFLHTYILPDENCSNTYNHVQLYW